MGRASMRLVRPGGRRGDKREHCWGKGVFGGCYRTSHKRPSEAVCFFVASSFRTRDWRVDESAGEASWRSRTFCVQGVGGKRLCSPKEIGGAQAASEKEWTSGMEAYFYISNHIVLHRRECHRA